MADTTYNSNMLIDLWSTEYKALYQEWLMGNQLVKWYTGQFPHGNKLTIPTFSELAVNEYVEGNDKQVNDVNTGTFELTIDKAYETTFKITDFLTEDSFYIDQMRSHFTSMLFRALMEKKELEIFELQSQQTAADPNTINGAAHRIAGSGTSNVIALADFYKAKYAMKKSNVPQSRMVAVLSPESVYHMNLIDNVFRQDVYGANSHIKDGMSLTHYLGRFGGFECYESNMLDTDSGSTSIDGTTSITSPTYNVFCAAGETFVGAMRREIKFETWRESLQESDLYSASVRYGLKLYRPESLVVLGVPSTI